MDPRLDKFLSNVEINAYGDATSQGYKKGNNQRSWLKLAASGMASAVAVYGVITFVLPDHSAKTFNAQARASLAQHEQILEANNAKVCYIVADSSRHGPARSAQPSSIGQAVFALDCNELAATNAINTIERTRATHRLDMLGILNEASFESIKVVFPVIVPMEKQDALALMEKMNSLSIDVVRHADLDDYARATPPYAG
jgi:hypothetical protein